jgi:Domain of unknown function (DUF4410)
MRALLRSAVVVVGIVLLLAAASAIAKNKAPNEKGVYKDWNKLIDHLEIVEPFQVTAFTMIVVLPLDTKQTPLPKQDDNTYPPTATALSKATDFFITGIKKRVAGKLEASIAEQAPTADAAKGVLLIRGEVLELNPGSRAARYWVGFGAGKSRAEIKGEIVNAETGAPLLKFSHARASSMGEGGGDYTTFLDDDIREVGEDIGKMLLSFEEGRP